ncbi:MAG: alpha/beta hydrolase [Chloroflexi bacterium]|nr:alpha/beta hydrolase [Chloroflexota bacterium]
MPLDPKAQQFLDVLAAAPPMHTLSAPEARAMSTARRDAIPPGPDVHRVEDRKIPGAGEIPVRIYWPSAERGLPVLVWYHGGGWVIGDLEGADPTCRRIALQAACIVVSVDYRLAPEHPAPAAYEDAYAAAAWVAANAASLGGDPARVAVGGDSAGGNLSASVTLMARDRGGPRLVHQLLVYPVTDHAMDTPSYRENGAYLLTPELMKWFWDAYAPAGVDRAHAYISPLRAPDLAGLPPAHLITAEFDPLRDEGRAYAGRLAAAGVPTSHETYAGQIHAFFTAPHFFDAGERAITDASAALRAAFTRVPAAG